MRIAWPVMATHNMMMRTEMKLMSRASKEVGKMWRYEAALCMLRLFMCICTPGSFPHSKHLLRLGNPSDESIA